ncbi:cytochrome c oxidase assembly factor 6 homolog isoform X1 [Neoarius graeffei]|uniref:cytochrome c oxidase assembly factor 6 homolog isoform X1 n=1 Tax=Neoarius graeffei TaxID=443677 RepID=UPI00298D43B3|nr:cytochrome c oxidase assembly factor 6 homolog isoform X1 [Neoarius graeffei]
MTAPNSKQRQACWRARDEFWKCLDLNQDNTTACEKYHKEFEANCPVQWENGMISDVKGCTKVKQYKQGDTALIRGEVLHQTKRLPEVQGEN